MAIKLPLFQDSAELVTDEGKPTFLFHRWWQEVVERVETSFNRLETIVLDIQAVQQAAADAQQAANDAQQAASDAQVAADSAGGVSKLSSSGVDGLTIAAVDAGASVTINISNHTRVYSDSTQVAVTGGSLSNLGYETVYYLFYNDPDFVGGAVTYQSTTIKSEAAQTGSRHLVGQVFTPAAGGTESTGDSPSLPGFGGLQNY